MSNHVDRRAFLEFLTVMAAGALTGCSEANQTTGESRDGGAGERVVVLGAGLAGLTAAYNLIQRGYEVIVLEGQNRVGGRVLTVREPFRNGGHAEMGATRIFSTHKATLKYVDLFGLGPLVPYDQGNRAYFVRGKRFMPPPAGEPWPIADMTDEEKADPFSFIGRYLKPGGEKVGDLDSTDWPNSEPSALELDKVTFEQYLREQGASTGWIDLFRAYAGNVKRINACAGFAAERVAAGPKGELPTSIAGGNDRLPRALAAALNGRVKLNSKVVGLEQTARAVLITYLDARGAQHQIRADRCVCALPFSALRKVTIATPFAPDKMRAIETLQYMPAARSYFQTATRFWANDRLGALGGLNLVGTDTFAGRIWNTSSQQADPTMGMIHAYMFDVEASEYGSLSDRIDAMRRHIGRKLLPGFTPDQVVGTADKLWQDDPWAGGGWGWTGLFEMRSTHQARRRPEGRVHFAGEHTSIWIAWMNGAIESGERAANEIVAASQIPGSGIAQS